MVVQEKTENNSDTPAYTRKKSATRTVFGQNKVLIVVTRVLTPSVHIPRTSKRMVRSVVRRYSYDKN